MDIRSIMAKATAATEFMYDRSAVVKRYTEIEKPNGADAMEWVTVLLDAPCRLSNAGLSNTDQGDANVIQYDVKLFLSSRYQILAGDEITVDGVQFASAEEPFKYVSHQEVLLKRKALA